MRTQRRAVMVVVALIVTIAAIPLAYAWWFRRGVLNNWAESTQQFAAALHNYHATENEPLPHENGFQHLQRNGFEPENFDAFSLVRYVPSDGGIELAFFTWPTDSPTVAFVAYPEGRSEWLKGRRLRDFLSQYEARSRYVDPLPEEFRPAVR